MVQVLQSRATENAGRYFDLKFWFLLERVNLLCNARSTDLIVVSNEEQKKDEETLRWRDIFLSPK